MNLHAHNNSLTLSYLPYLSPGPNSRSVPSDAQLHPSGTFTHHQLWLPSNLGWKLTCCV